MSETRSAGRRVFLSSVFREDFGGISKELPLRRRIIDSRTHLPVALWAAEEPRADGAGTNRPDADTIIDQCFAEITACDLFVFLVTERHGSGVGYVEGGILATYFELELLAAALLRKPILILHERGREPVAALRDSLRMLHANFSARHYAFDDPEGLYRAFRTACDRLAQGHAPFLEPAITLLPEWLSRWRSRPNFGQELTEPALRFLDGKLETSRLAPDPDRAMLLMNQASSASHGVALFRLWAAMRELMDVRSSALRDPSLAALWDRALGLWASNASWFGLHGHLWMGPLASIQSQLDLRRQFIVEPAFRAAADVREPLGARASALYSIGGAMQTWRMRVRHYRMAAAVANEAMRSDVDGRQGALLIRGHAARRLGLLGYAWRLWDSLADFREAHALREKSGASAASVGEARVDWGLALALTGRRHKGLTLAQEGITLLRSDPSANGKAFLARGLRSLERTARLAGRRDIAEKALAESAALARSVEALDQMRKT